MNVLIVEDDAATRRLVRRELEARGIAVTEAVDVESAAAVLHASTFDIAILDLTLPDGSGLAVLENLRRTSSSTHVIILSGAAAESDRIRALELGADDYVVKPFFARELAARVLAVRRRRDLVEDATLRLGHVEIDLIGRHVVLDGSLLELTAKEFDLLAFLAARPGHAFSRADLLRSVWHSAADWQQDATVTEHIRRLRTKLERDPHQPKMLRTVRGVGYRLDNPADDDVDGPAWRTGAVETGAVVHIDGTIVFADEGAASLAGHARTDALIGGQLLDFVAGGSSDPAIAQLTHTTSEGILRPRVVALQRPDGTEVLVEMTSSPVEWGGRIASRITMIAAADASSRLRHMVTGVFSEVSDAVIVTDLVLHIRSWNQAAERLYGWREKEVLGSHLFDIIRWTDDDADAASALHQLETTGRWYGEGRQVTRDGSSITVGASTTLVHDDDGIPLGVVHIIRPAHPAPVLDEVGHDAVDVRRAIDNDEFVVYYQPVMALDEHRMISVEALVRWNHPDRGILAPASFIDIAERSGLIRELGTVVLDKACRQVAAWRRDGGNIEVAVNLSARELADPELVARIAATLDASGLDPKALWLEVTETALVEDVDQATDLLHRLAELGIRIAIDDFGTGWASLTYLKQFPVHALKIDRTFVDGVDQDLNNYAIARSILSLGAELGIIVIAEGIETESQVAALRELGCSMGQGFLFAPASPHEDVDIALARRLAPG